MSVRDGGLAILVFGAVVGRLHRVVLAVHRATHWWGVSDQLAVRALRAAAMKRLMALMLVCVATLAMAGPSTISGPAHVVDGDSLVGCRHDCSPQGSRRWRARHAVGEAARLRMLAIVGAAS
jgi:hypothetical protein